MSENTSLFWSGFDEAFSSGRYFKNNPEVHSLSMTSVMLNMLFGDQILAKGTGWFWRLQEGVALVTAWHNLSGLHHTTRTALHSQGGIPDRIRFRYMTRNPQTFQEAEIPLFLDETRTQPRWFVHPICGSFFDMAYILLRQVNGDINCINDSATFSERNLTPGEDIFAIGFPQGIGTMQLFSVWKRGSIATDPDVLVDGLPKFYVDMAGRGGLSGAPVFHIQRGIITEQTSIRFGNRTEFVGIYTGRSADQLPVHHRSGESSDLGFVWRADVVKELLQGGSLDELPEVGKGEIKISEIWTNTDSNEGA